MKQIRTLGIVGTGMIAASLAVLTAGHGFRTVVLARNEGSAARCRGDIDGHFDQMTAHGAMTQAQAALCRSYLRFAYDYAALADAEAVFECVVEDAEVKYGVYRALEESCPHIKAVCSVSSSIVPSVLAQGADKYADRIVVTHPFNPPHLVPYFEVCAAERTAPGVTDYVLGLLKELDRRPALLKKPTPGFIGNRLQFALWREALALVADGVCEPRDVDTCLAYSFCPRYTSIGIYEHFDHGGMALNAATCRNIWPILSNATEIPDFMREMIAQGKLGARSESKQGFYDWNGADEQAYAERVSAPYWPMLDWELPETADET